MSATITSLLNESRVFAPSPEFSAQAHVRSLQEYDSLWRKSVADPESFWAEQARERLHWHKPWQKVFVQDGSHFQWFQGGQINATYNCLDRHLNTTRRDKTALIWEGEDGTSRRLTYAELHREVCRCANGLRQLGLKPGDVVSLYMPLGLELAIATLACARLGVVHNIIFAGFSSEAIAKRNEDCHAKVIITADGARRTGKILPLKDVVDQSLQHPNSVQRVVVLRHVGGSVPMQQPRDVFWDELLAGQSDDCPATPFDAEQPLFMLYTSGSTGKPKGMLHTTAGYLLGAATTAHYIFDLHDDDVFWCTADLGWITGHSYVLYGALTNGATSVLYEGAPSYPQWDRFWQIIDKYKVSKFYTAPTAIRSFMHHGEELIKPYDLSSLKLLGSVGEPINPEAWMWYWRVIGKERCPIVDTWWQTETGAIMIAPLPGAVPLKPGSATRPFFGIDPAIVDHDGKPQSDGEGGYLVIRKPWPAMARTIFGDHARYESTYWKRFPGVYFAGDGARRDADGNFWIMGRVDDVINISGHRLSTMEVESALVSHPLVTEAAVVGCPDPIKGEALVCFVILEKGVSEDPGLIEQLSQHVVNEIGVLARPRAIHLTSSLPKTRSGKIMRRLLRDIAAGRVIEGDLSTIDNQDVLEKLRNDAES